MEWLYRRIVLPLFILKLFTTIVEPLKQNSLFGYLLGINIAQICALDRVTFTLHYSLSIASVDLPATPKLPTKVLIIFVREADSISDLLCRFWGIQITLQTEVP